MSIKACLLSAMGRGAGAAQGDGGSNISYSIRGIFFLGPEVAYLHNRRIS